MTKVGRSGILISHITMKALKLKLKFNVKGGKQ